MYLHGPAFLLLFLPGVLLARQPVVDMHLHYKWSQQEITSAHDAVAALVEADVVLGVVTGTPAELALELVQADAERVVAIFGPYREGGDWHRWQFDDAVVTRARQALASGQYHGIGELHLVGGFAAVHKSGSVPARLLALAHEFDVPVMLHTEFASAQPMLDICTAFPDTTIIWAHAGAILPPPAVARVLDACRRVHAGLAARDPWRFVDNPLTRADGALLPEWRALLMKYPDRFMIGSDPVWPVDQLDRWDVPDTGWRELPRFWGFHRGWLAQLPADAARAIGCDNAIRLFRPAQRARCDH